MEDVHYLINFATMEKVREIKLFRNYFTEFYVSLPEKVRRKIGYSLWMVETQRIVPKKFFSFIEGSDGIYEIRTEYEGNIYRVFCCMDKGNLVVLFHGFQKKTQKTPRNQIERAEKLKEEYFKNKEEQ